MAIGCSAYVACGEFIAVSVAASVCCGKSLSRVTIIMFMLTVYITVHRFSVIIAHLFALFLPDEASSVGSGYMRCVC